MKYPNLKTILPISNNFLHSEVSVNADFIFERVLNKVSNKLQKRKKLIVEQLTPDLKRELTGILPKVMFNSFKPHEEIELKSTPLEGTSELFDKLYDPETYVEVKQGPKYLPSVRTFFLTVEDLVNNPEYKKSSANTEAGILKVGEGLNLAKDAFNDLMETLEPLIMKSVKKLEVDRAGTRVTSKSIYILRKDIQKIKTDIQNLEVVEEYPDFDEQTGQEITAKQVNTALTVRLMVNGWIRTVKKQYDISGLNPADQSISAEKLSVLSSIERLQKARELITDILEKSTLPEDQKERQLGLINGAKSLGDVISYSNQLIKSISTKKIASSSLFMPAQQEPIPLVYEDLPKRIFVRPVSEEYSKFLKTNFKEINGVEIPDDKAIDLAKSKLRNLIENSPDFNIMSQYAKEELIETLESRNYSSYEDVIDHAKSIQKKLTSLSQAFKNLFKIDYQNYTFETGYQIAVEGFETILENSNISEEEKDSTLETLYAFCEDDKSPGRVLTFVNFYFKTREQIDTQGSEYGTESPDRLFTILLTNPVTGVKYPPTYDFTALFSEIKSQLKKLLTSLFNEPFLTIDPLNQLTDEVKRDIFTMVKISTSFEHLEKVFNAIRGTLKNPVAQEEVRNVLRLTLTKRFKDLYKEEFNEPAELKFSNVLLKNTFKSLDQISTFLEERFSEVPNVISLPEREIFTSVKQIVLNTLFKYKAQPGNLQNIDAFFRPVIKRLYESVSPIITTEEEAFSTMKTAIRNTVANFVKDYRGKSGQKIDINLVKPILNDIDTSINFQSLMDAVRDLRLTLGEEFYSQVVEDVKNEMVSTVESLKNQKPIHFIQTKATQKENVMFDIAIQAVKKASSKKELMRVFINLPRYVTSVDIQQSMPQDIQNTLEKMVTEINNDLIDLANKLSQETKRYIFLNVNPQKPEAFETLINLMETTFSSPSAKAGITYTKFKTELYRTAVVRLFGLLRSRDYPESFIQEFADDVAQANTLGKLEELITKTFLSANSATALFRANAETNFSLSTREGIVKTLEDMCVSVAKREIAKVLRGNKVKGILRNEFDFLLEKIHTISDIQILLKKLEGEGMTGGDYLLLSQGAAGGEGGLYERAVELVKSSNMKKESKERMLLALDNYKISSKRLLQYIYNVYLAGEGLAVNRPSRYR